MVIPAAGKKVISAAESMGFTVVSSDFSYHKEPVLWASTSDDHKEGDVRTPAKDLPGVQIVGYRTEARLGFDVTYAGGFLQAHVHDPVGRPRELKVDYEYGPKEVKDYGYSQLSAADNSARRDREYNDGAQILQHDWYIIAANEFYAWIDEWLDTLKSEHSHIAPKKREKKEEPVPDLLAGDDWVG